MFVSNKNLYMNIQLLSTHANAWVLLRMAVPVGAGGRGSGGHYAAVCPVGSSGRRLQPADTLGRCDHGPGGCWRMFGALRALLHWNHTAQKAAL